MSLPALDTVTGALLIGTWANSLLYMLELIQGVYYFRHFKHDDWTLKTLVTVVLLIDTVSTIGDYICVYLYTITHAGDPIYLAAVHWPIPLYGFTTAIVAILVQSFLIIRYWRFTQNTMIAIFLFFSGIGAFASMFANSVMLTFYSSLEDRKKLKISVAFWLVTEVNVDLGIAVALLWELRKARGIKIETRSLLDRLTAVTIQSGGAAATLAVAALISYYINEESNVPVSFLYPLGRVYVVTLLSNLNIRKSTKSFSTTGTSLGPETTGRDSEREPPTFTRWTTDDPCGIHVHRTIHSSVQVVSHVEPRQCLGSTTIESSPEEIEMTASYTSKAQSPLSAA
ncbi:hypothetical protein MVEN_01687300 [Mycena venus]|uniref:DUF6534 domain-containing protein n=1 Tax=Mycena venus TaxID=2733690 RepID=A0A8H6XP26_9AGAR|nr:hypothetical protein MVEN_01687300 [Mycena venus]